MNLSPACMPQKSHEILPKESRTWLSCHWLCRPSTSLSRARCSIVDRKVEAVHILAALRLFSGALSTAFRFASSAFWRCFHIATLHFFPASSLHKSISPPGASRPHEYQPFPGRMVISHWLWMYLCDITGCKEQINFSNSSGKVFDTATSSAKSMSKGPLSGPAGPWGAYSPSGTTFPSTSSSAPRHSWKALSEAGCR